MTDPIQTQGQQQTGQQGYTDDILGGDDIFNSVSEVDEEEDLPYGDILEKKYKYEAIPELQENNLIKEEQKINQNVVVEDNREKTPEIQEENEEFVPQKSASIIDKVTEREIKEIDQQAEIEQEKVGTLLDTKLQTDVQKKFGELFFTTKRIYAIKEKLGKKEESFNVLGADNDKIFISYKFVLDETNDPSLVITKIEQDKSTEEEKVNELRFVFNEDASSLEVMVNDILLFDEIQDFTQDQKKKMQVSEKCNKFIFLVSEEQKKLEKEILLKEEEEKEKRRLQDIFRNF